MRPRTLQFKVGLYLTIALTVAMLAFTSLVVWHQRQELLANVAERVTQLSEVITKSTRYAMLQNQPDYVERIIHDVGNQEGIDKVRILGKDGRITHSTNPAEIGLMLDRKAEACSHCHQSEQPLEQVPRSERTWTFTTPEGKRMLGSMELSRAGERGLKRLARWDQGQEGEIRCCSSGNAGQMAVSRLVVVAFQPSAQIRRLGRATGPMHCVLPVTHNRITIGG